MRLPEENENLVEKVAVCSVERPFIITGQRKLSFGTAWVGLGLDGKGTAASVQPGIIAESGEEFHDKLMERFDGRMSYND